MSKPVDGHSSNPEKSIGRRLWWGLAAFGIVLLAVFGAVLFEAVTGHFSGTVIQVRIDECDPYLKMTALHVPASTYYLQLDIAEESLIEVRHPELTDPLQAEIRTRLWRVCFDHSNASPYFYFDRSAASTFYVKTGDVFHLRPGKQVTLVTYEDSDENIRVALTAYVDP